jgi:hypothetical protein
MWGKVKAKREVTKFEFCGNIMTRIFFPLILLYFVALSIYSFKFRNSLNQK